MWKQIFENRLNMHTRYCQLLYFPKGVHVQHFGQPCFLHRELCFTWASNNRLISQGHLNRDVVVTRGLSRMKDCSVFFCLPQQCKMDSQTHWHWVCTLQTSGTQTRLSLVVEHNVCFAFLRHVLRLAGLEELRSSVPDSNSTVRLAGALQRAWELYARPQWVGRPWLR